MNFDAQNVLRLGSLDHDGQGITEDAPKMGTWDETGEPVDVQQLLDFCHRQSVSDFPAVIVDRAMTTPAAGGSGRTFWAV